MMLLLRRRITLNIVILFFITIVSWGLGRPGAGGRAGDATTIILLIAAFKLRIVLLDFMELRTAPLILRLFAEVWVAALTLTILILHWVWTRHV
jgi:hypothetical protein